MSKMKTILLVGAFCVLTNGIQFGVQYYTRGSMRDTYTAEIATLNATLDSIGPIVSVYTVGGTVTPGLEITEDQITTMSLPSSMVTDTYVQDTSSIVGKLYKVAVQPGTPLTTDMIMERNIEDTTRDYDICVDRYTVGLKTGDYVDFRITLPYGDDYVVLPHLRIESIGTSTIKVYLNEEQWHRYQGAMVDYYLHSDQGASVYLAKYVEPGVQKEAEAYYAVPDNIEAIMLLDPNIVDKAAATATQNMRSSIDKILKGLTSEEATVEEESGKLNAGRSTFNGNVNSDVSVQNSGDEPVKQAVVTPYDEEEETVEEESESVFEEEVIE